MPVIKAAQSAPLLKEAIVLDLGDLRRQADILREMAQRQAREIMDSASAEAARLAANAHQQGYEEGLARGSAEGREQGLAEGRNQGREEALRQHSEQIKQLLDSWNQVCRQLEQDRNDLHIEARQAVLMLALRMAERITHRVIKVDPTVVADQLAVVLAHVLRPAEVAVRINPADRPVLEAAMPQLLAQFNHLRHVRLLDDATMSRGGCAANYGKGHINADVETQLKRLCELMLPTDTPVKD